MLGYATIRFEALRLCTDRQQEDAIGDRFYEFELPNMPSGGNEGYFDLKFAKAIDPDGPTSPPIFPWQLTTAAVEIGQLVVRGSTVDDTDGMV